METLGPASPHWRTAVTFGGQQAAHPTEAQICRNSRDAPSASGFFSLHVCDGSVEL